MWLFLVAMLGIRKTGESSRPGSVCVWAQSLSHVRLFVTSWTVAHQVPLSMGFSRQEYWSGLPLPSPGYLPDPGIEPKSPALQADYLLLESLEKPPALADISANSDLVSWRFSDQPWRDCWAGHSIWRHRVSRAAMAPYCRETGMHVWRVPFNTSSKYREYRGAFSLMAGEENHIQKNRNLWPKV